MNLKILVPILLVVLAISPAKGAGIERINAKTTPPNALLPVSSITPEFRVFTGQNAIQDALKFIERYRDHLTLRVNLSEFSTAHFVGIYLRKLPNGMYIPTYYISDSADTSQNEEEFKKHIFRIERTPLTSTVSVDIEPSRELKKIGTIIWQEKTTKICNTAGVCLEASHKVKADFWYGTTTSGQYDYYVFTKHEAEVPDKDEQNGLKLAVDSVKESVRILNYRNRFDGNIQVFLSDYVPYGSGESKEATKTWGINIGASAAPEFPYILPSISAGFSETSSDGLNFRWYVSSSDPNRDITFKFYKLRKGDSPAWDEIFRATTLTIVTVNPEVAFHEGDIEIEAKARFVGEYKKLYCPPIIYTGCAMYNLKTYKEAPEIKIKVEMYPWFILEKE